MMTIISVCIFFYFDARWLYKEDEFFKKLCNVILVGCLIMDINCIYNWLN